MSEIDAERPVVIPDGLLEAAILQRSHPQSCYQKHPWIPNSLGLFQSRQTTRVARLSGWISRPQRAPKARFSSATRSVRSHEKPPSFSGLRPKWP